jgi:predicted metal-dependent peptidase
MPALDVKARLERAHVQIMRDPQWRFLCGLMLMSAYQISDEVPTARTNGKTITYGSKFVMKLSDTQLRGLILHETFHVMYRQLVVWRKLYERNADLANQACDHVINLQILAAGEELPPNPCADKRFAGMDAGEVFRLLEQQQQSGGGGSKSGPGTSTPNGKSGGKPIDDHDWQGAQEMSKPEQEELKAQIDRALRQGKFIGQKVGNVPRTLTDLLAPQVDWRAVLAEFVKTARAGRDYSTWRRPARRHLHADLYLPSTVADSVDSIAIGVDTSGSIGQRELNVFMSEIQGIVKATSMHRMDLMYWDAAVARHEVYEGNEVGEFVHRTKPAGGGGTDVRAMFSYMQDKHIEPTCTVVLTDGYTPWPAAVHGPTLFVITSEVTAPVGTTVRLQEN